MMWRALSVRPYPVVEAAPRPVANRAPRWNPGDSDNDEQEWSRKVGPGGYCSTRHPTHFELSFLQSGGIHTDEVANNIGRHVIQRTLYPHPMS
jgi:hypothetical protein